LKEFYCGFDTRVAILQLRKLRPRQAKLPSQVHSYRMASSGVALPNHFFLPKKMAISWVQTNSKGLSQNLTVLN
jgi:hypothetical protein